MNSKHYIFIIFYDRKPFNWFYKLFFPHKIFDSGFDICENASNLRKDLPKNARFRLIATTECENE